MDYRLTVGRGEEEEYDLGVRHNPYLVDEEDDEPNYDTETLEGGWCL